MSKVTDAILGFAVGDALGLPYEFEERDNFHATGMAGYDKCGYPIGTWSDDTSMVLATMDSIIQCNGVDYKDLMEHFRRWEENAEYTPYKKTIDIGTTVWVAILKYKMGYPLFSCGSNDLNSNGNGALMRIPPLGFLNVEKEVVENVAALTHGHKIAKSICWLYTVIMHELIYGEGLKSALNNAEELNDPEVTTIKSIVHIKDLKRNEIRSFGYVVDTFVAAIWCVATTNSYKECVLKAVNLGYDTDTITALAGSLAGIIYGMDDIDWVNELARIDYIKEICNEFEKTVKKNQKRPEGK